MRPSKRSSIYYYILSGIFFGIALFTLVISSSAAVTQNNARHHPIKLLSHSNPITRFLLTFPLNKQKNYFVLGLVAGLFGGVCLGAAIHHSHPKNQK